MKKIKLLLKPISIGVVILRKSINLIRTLLKAIQGFWFIRTKVHSFKKDNGHLHKSLDSLKPIIQEIDRVMSSPDLLHDKLSSVITKIQQGVQRKEDKTNPKIIDHEFHNMANQLHSILNEGLGLDSSGSRIIEAEPIVQQPFATQAQLTHFNHDLDDLSLEITRLEGHIQQLMNCYEIN
ncbi:hypothetical protein [Legionella waltersii]|uniref:Uncharacterized protein n=1 Tax=Legionella waltersii TaxID=66969 RepID=A0A0W1A503_9GAMM|nr:hypothetical protein [Legionella waltersii]KTD76410.1 hypothetical protein Lwal_2132 [Legionella waltersii]SNV14306.1 Uncharacterised protein [Legionella waltersii]